MGDEQRYLVMHQDELRAKAAERYLHLLGTALRITTPDAKVNQALAWAEVTLEQGWVCDRGIGCAGGRLWSIPRRAASAV